ncbi:hypothetical protein L7F22_063870 [Adiantum nelumboides]|nr:hypothetical protein [Adiantum nelumboides]
MEMDQTTMQQIANSLGSQDEDEDENRRERGDARKKQIEQFWALIYTKFPSQRTILTTQSIQSLSDKSSTVRKNAISLLTKLILTHPFGMHGGDLDKEEWEKRLAMIDNQLKEYDGVLDVPSESDDHYMEDEEMKSVEGEAKSDKMDTEEDPDATQATASAEDQDADQTAREEEVELREESRKKARASIDLEELAAKLSPEDAEKVVRLRLTRRYHTDALAFIDQLSLAVPTLSQLLVSTSKAEVLESMEFFRVAHEYRIPGAHVGVRKMIHLIWTKDNNTLVMEDGKELKGIKSRLIEVYRSLYFDPLPNLSNTDNINRIARNLVERTFDVTLAELTSLEEMLSTMCGENMIDERVIDKLCLAEHAIQTIYLLGEQPDALCAEMIKQMTGRVFGSSGPKVNETESASIPPTPILKVKYQRQLQRRKAEADKEKVLANKDTNKSDETATEPGEKGKGAKKGRGGKRGKNKAAAQAEEDADELDQVAGNAEDDIGDVVGEVPAVSPFSFIYLARSCRTIQYRDRLGDCAISFGSLIDENSEKLYAGLGDLDLGVKKHTLMVLTHLILNGQ